MLRQGKHHDPRSPSMPLTLDLAPETFIQFTFVETGKVISVLWMELEDGRLALSQCCDPASDRVPLHHNLAVLTSFKPVEIWPDVTLCYEPEKRPKLSVTAPRTVRVMRSNALHKARLATA